MRAHFQKILLSFLALVAVLVLGFPMLFLDGHKGGVIKLDKEVTISFDVKDNVKDLLLYFGYVGCEDICLPALKEIASIYDALSHKKSVQIYFINLAKKGEGSELFARYFHKDFLGLELRDIGPLQNQLRVYSSASLSGDGKISHTGFLYRIQRYKNGFKLRSIYVTKPFNAAAIIEDFTKDEM